MKKNICPYLNSQNECTHKDKEKSNPKKLSICIYSNPLKCEYYNLWLNKKKSLRMAKNEDETTIRSWLEEMKRRYLK